MTATTEIKGWSIRQIDIVFVLSDQYIEAHIYKSVMNMNVIIGHNLCLNPLQICKEKAEQPNNAVSSMATSALFLASQSIDKPHHVAGDAFQLKAGGAALHGDAVFPDAHQAVGDGLLAEAADARVRHS